MKNFTQVNRASSGAKKNFTQLESNLSGMAWFLHVIERRFSSTDRLSGSRSERSLTSEETSIQHPFSIHSASIGHPLEVGGNQVATMLRYVATVALFLCLGVGQMWGTSYTWSFDNSSGSKIDLSNQTKAFTSLSGSKTLTYVGNSSESVPAKTAYLKMNAATAYSSNALSKGYFYFAAPSTSGTISIAYNTSYGNALIRSDNGDYQILTASASTTCTSSKISGLTANTTTIYIAFAAASYIESITWTVEDDPASMTSLYSSLYKSTMETGASISGTAAEATGGSGWVEDYAKYYTASGGSNRTATVTFGSALALNSNGSNRGKIRIWYGTTSGSSGNTTIISEFKINNGSSNIGSYGVLEKNKVHIIDYTIPNDTTSLKSVYAKIAVSGGCLLKIEVLTHASASTKWTFMSKNSSSEWEEVTEMPEADNHLCISDVVAVPTDGVSYKVFKNEAADSYTREIDWQYMPIGPTNDRWWTSGGHTTSSNLGGALGRFYIYDDNTTDNHYIGFIPAAYALRTGTDGDGWTTTAFTAASSSHNETTWTTGVKKFNSTNADDYIYVALGKENNGYVACAQSQSRRQVFVKLHSDWTAASAKYYIWYWENGTSNNGWSDLMTAVPGVSNEYVGWIPEGSYNRIKVVRFNPSDAVANWSGNIWNATKEITLNSEKNYLNINGQDGNGAQDYTGEWGLYRNGIYRIWIDNHSKNFALHYYPQNVLSYDANGGTGTIADQYVSCDAVSKSVTVAGNDFTRAGWTFTGWNTEKHGKGTAYAAGDDINVTSDITLYAQWQRTVYLESDLSWWYDKSGDDEAWFSIYYWDSGDNTANGKGWVEMEVADACEPTVYKATLPGNGFNYLIFVRKTSDTDLDWDNVDNQSVDVAYPTTNPKYTITSTSDSKVTGTWGDYTAPTKYSITFNAGTGSGSMSAIEDICEGTDQALTANSFTAPTGYEFDAWHANVDVTVSSSIVSKGDDIDDEATLEDLASDVTLTAQWKAKTYTITLNRNGGSGDNQVITATYGSSTLSAEVTTPTRDGYNFRGWYNAAGGTGYQVINTSGTLNASVTGFTNSSSEWIYTTTSSLTLVARWTQCSAYSFTYGTHGQNDWASACFSQVGETNEWNITDFTIPNKPNFYVGWTEDFVTTNLGNKGSWSVERAWTDVPSQSDSKWQGQIVLLPTASSAVGQATGAVGKLVIWDNSANGNLYVGFKPNGYGLTYTAGTIAFNNWGSTFCETDVVTLTSSDASGNFQVKLATSDSYVACAHGTAENASAVNGRKITGDVDIANGKKGVFQMWTDAAANNFGLRFVTVHDVSFNMQSHGDAIADYTNVRYNDKIVAPTAPTASGYTFGGWYKEAGCTNAWDFANDVVTEATTLYAKWTVNQYSVTHSLSNVTATSGATGANAATYGTNYTAEFAAAGGFALPSDITVQIGGVTKTKDTHYTWNSSTGALTVTGSYITGDIAISFTAVSDCPTGGDIFKLEMTYSGSEVSVAANTVADWSASYGTKDGGDVKFGNVNGSSAGKIKIQANQINLGSNDGYIKLILDCPLKQNDVLSFTSSNNYELCFTTDDSYNNSVKSSSKKWTVPKSFNNESTIYIWRANTNTNNIYTINIVRPVTVTFDKNGGSSVSPSSATYDGTSSNVLASATRTDYHLDGWNTKSDGSGDDLGLPGETYYLDDVTTSTTTIYAQWSAKSCASGTIYQFTLNTGLTNDNFPKTTEVYVKTSDYLATMTGGYLKAYNSSTDKLKITDNKYICINSSSSYLLVQLDCPLRAGDQIKSTVKSQALYITKGSDSRASTYSLPIADNNLQTIPAAWAGATEIKIWAGSSNGGKIQDFQIIRAASTYNVTYDDNDKTSGSVPTDETDYSYNASVTVDDNDGSLAKTNYDDLAYWNTKDDGTGTDYAIGSGTFNITDNTTLYAKWTQAVTLNKNGGTTDGSATAVWNAKGLTSFTAVVPASGYKCTGYYTTSSGAGTKVLNADGTYASSSVTDYVTSGKWSRTGAAPTLYARYEAGGALTWNLSVNTTATSLTTSSKTSAFTEISTSNMTNAAVTGLTYTGNAKSNLTGKISTPASEDASKYISVSFQVASGYKFIPSSIKVKVQPISAAQYVKLELKDNAATPNSITYTTASAQSKGSISTVEMTNGEDVEFTGTVTLKIFCYGTAYDTDGYRLGTPITIEGEIQEACATKPNFSSMSYSQTEYTVDDDASAISIVGGTNIDTYAWKQNTVNDRSGGEVANGDSDGDSYTPPTSSAGTMYYWCEMTNTDCDITIKSAAVGITVSASKTDATITWTDPASTPNYGGGAYTVKATVNETGWNGTAADLSITAPEGIRIYSVTSGTTDSKKWVQATFDVTTSFDRETYSSNIPFTVSHAATSTYNAISDSYDVSYTSCSGGGEGTANIPVLSATHDEGSGNAPRYWWETTGNGRILALNYGKSDCSSTSDATFTSDGFSYVASSTNQRVVFQPYVSGVTKIRVYVKSATNTLTISSIGVNASWKDQSSKYSAISTDTIIYSNDKTTGLDNKDKGYMEVEFSSALTANSYYMITFSSSSVYLYGIKLYSSSAGSGGSLTTTLAFADDATVNKNQGDASFTKTASLTTANTNSLGSITYSSSNTSCATVNATTGEVTITATGSSNLSTTITATLSASGCYKGATASYTLNVSGSSCTDVAGTVTTTDLGCSGIRLTLSGYTAGATIKWYKDGDEIKGETGTTYTATEAGSYYAVTHNDCNKASNTVVIAAKTVSAERVVEKWYIKNGRVTPDIALWSVGKNTILSSVAWSPANTTGLTASDFYLQDGVIYLKGTSPSSNDSGADIEYTLTLTVSNGCNITEMSDASKKIKLVHQKNTDKHVLAFVVVGTANGGFTEGIPASQTTSVPLYNEIAKNFDVQATNIKSTDDEKALKEYYSQFDILCITDYPSTGDKGSHSKSYVDAIGSLIDIRPILTMEAFVAKLSNWAAKGISGTPKSPCPRQYSMDLQCKDHEIFSGTELVKIGEGDEAMYRVTMVDKTKADYSTKDAETECSKAYDAGGYPALQGFTFDATMLADGLLPLGLIHNGESEELQVGLERQEEMSARLMVLGIQQKAMERLTDDGQKVVINALKYLMKKNAEDIADCSNTFVGGDSEEDESTRYNWNVASHWSGNALPDCTQKVRIVAPCVIPDGQKVHVAEVIIAPDGKYNHGSDNASGSLTIAAGGALVVEGEVEAATAPNYNTKRATSASDLVIKASSTKQGALIFDNIEGETMATVEMYSPSYWEVQEGTNKKKSYWSYVGVPIQDVPVGEYFYGAVTYLYDETSGWIRKRIGSEFHAFEGIGLSLPEGHKETFYGTLASTETKEITLTKTTGVGEGDNLIGNSWTAPIQIGNFDSDDFGSAAAVVSMYKTGRDDIEGNPTVVTATAENDGAVEAGQWVSIPIGLPGTDGYDGPTVIPSMQAFQVTTSSETTLTLDYDKLVRDVTIATDNLTQPMSAPKRKMKHTAKKSLDAMMRIRMSGFKTRADLWIMEDGRFSDEYDNGWEANYIECDNRSPQLYANSEIGKMAFLAKPDIEGTILGIAPSRDGNEYLFTFHYVGDEEFYLNDLKLKQSVLISEEESYSFMYEEGDTNRFYISRTRIDAPQMPTGVDNTRSGEVKAQKFIYNDKMYIMINGRVYSAEGQMVK